MTPDQSRVVVADSDNHRLVVLDATDGRPVSDFIPPGDVMHCPCGVVIVPHTGQVLVADSARSQVLLFAGLDAPHLVRTFGDRKRSRSRDFRFDPVGVGVALIEAVDVDFEVDPAAAAAAAAADGADPSLVVIADTWYNRVVIYRLCDGALVRQFGSGGSALGQFASRSLFRSPYIL